MKNQITGPRKALINGEETALAGCNTKCNRHEQCLRSDLRLLCRFEVKENRNSLCSAFINSRGILHP